MNVTRMFTVAFWLFAVTLLVPVRAGAQCAFDAPVKAGGFKSSMVRAYAGCLGGITFPASNTSTMAGVPGCTPPFALSEYRFDDERGGCSVQVSQIYESPCTNALAAECADFRFKAKCSGVLDSDGITPASQPGWGLNMVLRVTWEDESQGDMTVGDFPVQFAFPQATDGRFKLDSTLDDLCFSFDCPPVPICTQTQLLSASIIDPDGNVFAVLGSSSR